MKKIAISLAATVLLCLPSAYATSLSPGQSIAGSGDNFPLLHTSYAGLPISGSASSGELNVSYIEYVDVDADNVFCSGCLDFLIQVTNNSSESSGENLEHVTFGSFAGFLTDVGIFVGAQKGVDPTSIDRTSGLGTVVTFDFSGSGNIKPGETSDYLVVQTNATSFAPGSISIQDDTSVNVPGFAPAPEPMSLSLLGGGLALFGFAGLRRRARVKK
jgi:hypothetical protein